MQASLLTPEQVGLIRSRLINATPGERRFRGRAIFIHGDAGSGQYEVAQVTYHASPPTKPNPMEADGQFLACAYQDITDLLATLQDKSRQLDEVTAKLEQISRTPPPQPDNRNQGQQNQGKK